MSLHPHPKIHQTHLDRVCVIYIRQSSLKQVMFNTASTARQYDFQQIALDYGWLPEKIIVVDDDQGITGTAFGDRPGFRRISEEISRGHIGALCALESSRLSRDDVDFTLMIGNCRWTDTLIIDEDGVYDPKDPNDRLLLGIKGSLGAAELQYINSRLIGGRRQKALDGELRFLLPPGYIHDQFTKEIIFDPDPEVQRVVRLFFDLFDEIGTASGVCVEFERLNQLFPSRSHCGLNRGKIVWRVLTPKVAVDTLHNPIYASAYAFGRKKTVYSRVPGELLRFKARQVCMKREDWAVLKLDHHEGYITWDKYLQNEQRLAGNISAPFEGPRGPLGSGSALLQGIAICGNCGSRLTISYPRGNYSLYHCHTKGCHLSFTGQSHRSSLSVDKEVEGALLTALEPAQLMISIDSLKQAESTVEERSRQWELQIERASRKADEAEFEFNQADPTNRRVKGILAKRWEKNLAEVDRLKLEQMKQPEILLPVLDEDNRRAIMALAQDIPRFWHAETTTNVQRKTLLRYLIEDVTLRRDKSAIYIMIRWITKTCTYLRIDLKSKRYWVRTDPKVINKIRELVANHSDRQIVEHLNEAGFRPAKGKKFTLMIVRSIRFVHGIKPGCPDCPIKRSMLQRGDGRYSTRGAAEKLNVSIGTIQRWCHEKILDAVQSSRKSALWIELTPEIIERLRKPVQQLHSKNGHIKPA
jgi:DNA invertase Pin-like site-specific DNA recombinase